VEYNNRAKELNRRNEDLKKKKKLFKQKREEELRKAKGASTPPASLEEGVEEPETS